MSCPYWQDGQHCFVEHQSTNFTYDIGSGRLVPGEFKPASFKACACGVIVNATSGPCRAVYSRNAGLFCVFPPGHTGEHMAENGDRWE